MEVSSRFDDLGLWCKFAHYYSSCVVNAAVLFIGPNELRASYISVIAFMAQQAVNKPLLRKAKNMLVCFSGYDQ